MTSVNAQHEALLDALLKDYTDPQDILGEHGLLKQLTKRLGYAPRGCQVKCVTFFTPVRAPQTATQTD
jgi:hypothetical protein